MDAPPEFIPAGGRLSSRVRATSNERVPDLGVTCSSNDGRVLTDPVVLIEIMSLSDEAGTRRNIWAYASIPGVAGILLLSSASLSGELLRRNPQGEWADDPLMLDADSLVELPPSSSPHRCATSE